MERITVVLFVTFCFGAAGGTYYVAVHQLTQTMQAAEQIEATVVSTDG